ncbi:preprotein translocase subunit SecG [Candidatus Providencia siddallii]|uniref:Protein-export membrane protein SecG n=1 Tax=Candidatus Providencia siddallii TaxID=1715285 RepID=A0ABM9NPF9_9GAMM
MYTFFLIAYLLIAICLISLIMLQQGKNSDMCSSGAISSTTLFGSSGSDNFITKTTGILATIFFIINLIIVNITANVFNVKNKKWENISESTKNFKNIKTYENINDIPK